MDPDFLDAESRYYRERDGLFVADRRPFLMEIHSRCTLAYDFSGITYEQKTSAELHEQAENPAEFDDLCDTINKTANIRTLDSNGNLATHRAVSGAALDNLKLLIIAGVRATATNTAGKTPLDLAQQKHSATADSELRETLSTIAMVIRASGGECVAESGTLCGIEYDSLYGDGHDIDYVFIDYVTIPSTFKGSSIYQLHHPEYGKMTLVQNITPSANSRLTITPDGEIRVKEDAILKWDGYSVHRLRASNEHLPYPAYMIVPISVSIMSHPQPWTTPPIRKVAPNYTGAYFTVTATPPSGQLGYSFGPGERATYRLINHSKSGIRNVVDGDSIHSYLDFLFANDLRSYKNPKSYFSSDIEAATWQRNVVQMTTADQRLAATYQNGAFAVSLNQAIGQGDPQVHAVHMFVDPYDYRNETQVLNFTIAVPSIPENAVYEVGPNHTGLVSTQMDPDLRNVNYEVISKDSSLNLSETGELSIAGNLIIGGEATVAAKVTSPDLLGTLTITAKVVAKCTTNRISVLQYSSFSSSDYQRLGDRLFQAAGNANLSEVCRLIERGADPNYISRTSKNRPLALGAIRGIASIARALIVHGAKADFVYGQFSLTPLHNAARNFRTEYARVLLENDALVAHQNSNGDYPVNLVPNNRSKTEAEYYELFNLLKTHGASLDARGRDGQTSLINAVEAGNLHWAGALADLEASINTQDSNGHNACYYAEGNDAMKKRIGCS